MKLMRFCVVSLGCVAVAVAFGVVANAAIDLVMPQGPKEIAFYVPESNANTDPDGYMTNNLEVDNRGYIYAVDRNGAGLDIIELTGKARRIALGQDTGHGHDKDD